MSTTTSSTTATPNVPDNDKSAADKKECCSTCKSKFIDLVNPKFKSFNKPFFLALIVGITTLILTVVLAAEMLQNCKMRTYSGNEQRLRNLAADDTFGCFEWIHVLTVLTNTGRDPAPSYEWCVYPSDDAELGADAYCDGRWDEGMATAGLCSQYDVGLTTPVFLVYNECPDVLTTIGSAFGWATFIELGVTLIVCAILMPLGILNNDHSFMKEIVQGLIENKETGQEIADVI